MKNQNKKSALICAQPAFRMRAVAIATLMLTAGVAAAQQTSVVPTTQGQAEQTSDQKMAEVIVRAEGLSRYVGTSGNAAARLPADPMDLPVAGVSLPRALLDDQGVIRVAEAVRNVSAVTRNPAYLGLTDSYRVRGFQSDVGLWNGFRRDFYYSFTDTAHVERVEVIKGGASVTYGNLEPGGVINYVTKRPSRNPVNSVRLTAGSNKLVRPEFDLGWTSGGDGSVRVRVTGAMEKADSFRDFVESRHKTIGAALDWDLVPGTRLELSAYWLDSNSVPDRGFFNAIGPLVLKLPITQFQGEPGDRFTLEQTDLSAMLSHRFSNNWSVRGGVNAYRVNDVRDNVQFRNMQADGHTMRRQYTYVPDENKYVTTFGELRGDFVTGSMEHTLVAGLERISKDNDYNFMRDRSSGYLLDLLAPVYGQYARPRGPSDRYSFDSRLDGVYVQDLIKFGEYWRVLAGLRHSRYSQADKAIDGKSFTEFAQSETTPRLGVLYRVSPAGSLFASYSRSFTPQQYSYTTLTPGISPAPEQGRQFEIGYKHTSIDEKLVAGMTVFQIEKSNVATASLADPTLLVLSGEQTVRGVEFDASAKLGSGWSLIGSYAWMDGFVSKDNSIPVGQRLVNTPRHQASTWVRHDFAAVPGLGASVGVFAVGKREAQLPNTWTIPGFARLDASMYYKLDARTDLALHVKNLGDKVYYDSQGNLSYPGAPRSFSISAKYRF